MKALRLATVALVMSLCGAVSAATNERGANIGWKVRQPTRFIVSGVLRKDGSTDVIKPIHGIVTADDSAKAIAAFSNTARQQYPGYALIATLASPVPQVGTCENNI
ncbi:hypothetical protein [Paraburkholderia kururiensis]|uniref:hypothetical protein n=1 Tax=Paraburkholderia kururiensis TaxID=984307 RepID=UPI000ACFE36B|nr:hypothetical protein [Paraburkholderia kururiensis]